MSKQIFKDLLNEVQLRESETDIATMDLMANLYEGHVPPEYEKYFPSNSPKQYINLIKNAWNDLTVEVGRLPDLRVDALDETQREEKRAGLLERIGHKYLRDSEPTGKQFMRQIAWWLVGAGRSIGVVIQNKDGSGPTFSTRDPRTAYPKMRTVGNVPVEIYDIIFDYKIPTPVAVEMGLARSKDTSLPIVSSNGPQNETRVLEFFDDRQHVIVSEEGLMSREMHGLGKVPVWVFQNFAPNSKNGLSLFESQISLMMSVSILVSLKMAAADKNVNPVYWAKGHVGSIKIGPNVLNKLSSSGEIGMLTPPNLIQTDRDIQQLVAFSNIFNKNPEVRQGQTDAKGQYVSAKTLEQLAESIDTTLGDYWDIISPGLEHLFSCAFRYDEKEWGKEEKRITQNIKGKTLRDAYTPNIDIDGHYAIHVDYGFGVGGYQGFLQNLQANQAKVRSRKKAMEEMPGVSDVDQELRQISIEDLDDAGMALIQSQAASGQLDMLRWAAMREGVAKGKSLHKIVKEQEEELRAQAAAASQAPAGVAPLTAAPEGEAEGQAAPSAPPGLNPAGVF